MNDTGISVDCVMTERDLNSAMRRPSILFMNRVYPPRRGASGTMLRDLARSFAQEGWQVTIITTGDKAATERDGAIRIIRVKMKPGTERRPGACIMLWFRMLFTALKLPKFHVLVTLTDPPLLISAGQIVKRFKGCRHINWCHDLYPDILPALDVKLPRLIMKFLQAQTRRAMRKADRVIVIGRCMARHLNLEGVDPKHITVVPNWFGMLNSYAKKKTGQSNDNQMNGQGVKYEIAQAKPYPDQIKAGRKFRVMYAGSIGRAHPMDTILKAAEILHDDCPDIEFVFLGEGPGFDRIVDKRNSKNLENIRMLPYQPAHKLSGILKSGDLHLISVRDEAAGMLVPCKFYAALAVNRPSIFIGPGASEIAKVITDFQAGSIIAQGDAERLAAEIKKYRMDCQTWFNAQTGAFKAAEVFQAKNSINAWMERAWQVVQEDLG